MINFHGLEQAIRDRDSILMSQLRPGLSKKQILRLFDRAKVHGSIEYLINLYSWKDGVNSKAIPIGDSAFEISTPSFLPKNAFYFIEIRRAIADYQALEEVAVNAPLMREAVGRYFPIFWNGDLCWLAVDLFSKDGNEIIFLNWHEKKLPFRVIYNSFKDLVDDITHVQKENLALESINNWEI